MMGWDIFDKARAKFKEQLQAIHSYIADLIGYLDGIIEHLSSLLSDEELLNMVQAWYDNFTRLKALEQALELANSQLQTELQKGEFEGLDDHLIASLQSYIVNLRSEIETLRNELLEVGEGGVTFYQGILNRVFGITIIDAINRVDLEKDRSLFTEDFANLDNDAQIDSLFQAFQALNNYHVGAEEFGAWLVATYDELNGLSPYEAFRQVMGPMEVNRTTTTPSGVLADSKGFTQDHIIYDRFDLYQDNPNSDYQQLMSADLFVHELVHAFVTSSGFGTYLYSPINQDVDVYDLLNILDVRGDEAYRNSSISGYERTCKDANDNKVDCSSEAVVEIIYHESEIIANFIQHLITANSGKIDFELTDDEWDSLSPSFQAALDVNQLRNAPVEDVVAELDMELVDDSTHVSEFDSVRVYNSQTADTPSLHLSIKKDDVVIFLGQNADTYDDSTRFYVAVDKGGKGFHNYVWIERGAYPNDIPYNLPTISDNPPNPFSD
jgi:hypothetical protein